MNSVNKKILDLIEAQLSAFNSKYEVLEWIPYNKFYDIEYIAKGGFGKVYREKCIDGCACWANLLNRSKGEIRYILYQCYYESYELERIDIDNKTELQKQIKEAEKINNSLPTTSSILFYKFVTQNTYRSKFLQVDCLILITFPEPKNSDDYYNEQNDNIISEIFSGDYCNNL
ncbi:hypothetical protein RhiirA5_423828 [Rhizophagus irregularis]|uniref:Protein kinase domain-containing protein n=1 Tax=Rhizophagus irregularis TaxID=588596 RepID=A0A2N0P990_9GLOM|nr:hypothetical protein RhiirA5_423828 [Rhizophagus irregularis]